MNHIGPFSNLKTEPGSGQVPRGRASLWAAAGLLFCRLLLPGALPAEEPAADTC